MKRMSDSTTEKTEPPKPEDQQHVADEKFIAALKRAYHLLGHTRAVMSHLIQARNMKPPISPELLSAYMGELMSSYTVEVIKVYSQHSQIVEDMQTLAAFMGPEKVIELQLEILQTVFGGAQAGVVQEAEKEDWPDTIDYPEPPPS
jgi:hypothetical protein